MNFADMLVSDDDNSDVDPTPNQNEPTPKRKSKVKPKPNKKLKRNDKIPIAHSENLIKSNFLHLQITGILDEIAIKKKHNAEFTTWLKRFTDFLTNLDETPAVKIDSEELGESILQDLLVDNKSLFKFIKPNKIRVMGPYHYQTAIGPGLDVNISLEIPGKCFIKADMFNCRYFHKRFLYLNHIKSKWPSFEWTFEDNQYLMPILKTSINSVNVYVHVTIENGPFKLASFTPEKNKIKANAFNLLGKLYNLCFLKDLTRSINDEYFAATLDRLTNVRNAVKLVNLWLKQRHFHGFAQLITGLVVYGLKTGTLNDTMSVWQVVRNVWLALASGSLETSGVSLADSVRKIKSQPSIVDFHECFDVVLIDRTGYFNLAGFLDLDVYLRVKMEAGLALRVIDSNQTGLEMLFVRKWADYEQFDHVFCISKSAVEQIALSFTVNYEDEHIKFHQQLLVREVIRLLKRGLTTRVDEIVPIFERERSTVDFDPIKVGLKYNPSEAFRVLDKGSEANLPAAAVFREFWGDKSQLRRFQDGAVMEAVFWERETIDERRGICREIVDYLLEKNYGIDTNNVRHHHLELTTLLNGAKFNFNYGTGEEIMSHVTIALDELSRQLRQLKKLPLQIISVHPVSAVYRSTSVFPPIAKKPFVQKNATTNKCFALTINNNPKYLPFYTPTINAILQLEVSNKWPKNLEAIENLKTAFYLKITQALQSQFHYTCQYYTHAFDVLKNGWVFRFEIYHEKELGLNRRTEVNDGVVMYRDTPASRGVEREYVMRPKVCATLQGLSAQYASFGTACRLLKRWLRGQLLDGYHVADVAVELLMACVYLAKDGAPSLPHAAFLRALALIARTDWKMEGVFVNFNDELDAEQIAEVERGFLNARDQYPAMFICTPYDNKSIWTRNCPSENILARIVLLAKRVLAVVADGPCDSYKPLFTPSMDGYDLLIHLDKTKCVRNTQSLEYPSEKTIEIELYTPDPRERIPVVNFDPVQLFLKELRGGYDDFAFFFHDTYGGATIGVLWKPYTRAIKEVTTTHMRGHCLTEDGERLVFNTDAVVDDFYVLGKGLITFIDVKK